MTRRSLFKKTASVFVGGLAMRFLPTEVYAPYNMCAREITERRLEAISGLVNLELTTQYAINWERVVAEQVKKFALPEKFLRTQEEIEIIRKARGYDALRQS